jgi:hypothetical protein
VNEIARRRLRAAKGYGRGAQGRFYVGRRSARTEVYVVTLCDVEHLRPRMRGPEFSWGPAAAPGGAELAFAILGDVTRREPSEQLCARFELDVLASLPRAGFVLGRDDVVLWLAVEQRDAGTEPPAARRAGGRLEDALARAVRRFRGRGFRAANPSRTTP